MALNRYFSAIRRYVCVSNIETAVTIAIVLGCIGVGGIIYRPSGIYDQLSAKSALKDIAALGYQPDCILTTEVRGGKKVHVSLDNFYAENILNLTPGAIYCDSNGSFMEVDDFGSLRLKMALDPNQIKPLIENRLRQPDAQQIKTIDTFHHLPPIE